jgi:spore cortex biosynthesis protein YabQ
VHAEAVLMLSALFVGMVYGFCYDTIRIVRRMIVHRRVLWIAVEDIIFWITAALHTYITFYQGTNGILRGYIVIGILGGAGLYRVAVGVMYVKYVTRGIRIVRKYMTSKFEKTSLRSHVCGTLSSKKPR